MSVSTTLPSKHPPIDANLILHPANFPDKALRYWIDHKSDDPVDKNTMQDVIDRAFKCWRKSTRIKIGRYIESNGSQIILRFGDLSEETTKKHPDAIAACTRNTHPCIITFKKGEYWSDLQPGMASWGKSIVSRTTVGLFIKYAVQTGIQLGKFRDIYTVALHEIGHALGLDHVDNKASIMQVNSNEILPLMIYRGTDLVPAMDANAVEDAYSGIVARD